MANANAVNHAVQGEIFRKEGNYTSAIAKFTDAINALNPNSNPPETYSWAYAHRGAARAELEDLGAVTQWAGSGPNPDPHSPLSEPLVGSGFTFDFAKAIWQRQQEGQAEYPWARAQWGEAYRIYLRGHMWKRKTPNGNPDAKVSYYLGNQPNEDWFQKAIGQFNLALAVQPQNAWALAHRGATYALRFFLKRYVFKGQPPYSGDDGAADSGVAAADFNMAKQASPTYSWALAFEAVLQTLLGQFELAREASEQAQLYDVNHRLVVLRPIALLSNYAGAYGNSVTAGWQALQENPHDFIARYVVTASLALAGAPNYVPPPIGDPRRAAIRQMRAHLQSQRSIVMTLLAGINLLEGNTTAAHQILQSIRKQPDLDCYAILALDNTFDLLPQQWQGLRQPPNTVENSAEAGIPDADD